MIKMSGEIEMNPGPNPSSCDKFSICHWNLLRVYISIHNFDILCLSETSFESTISSNNSSFVIPSYDFFR